MIQYGNRKKVKQGTCYWCGRYVGRRSASHDHVIPKSKGGTWEDGWVLTHKKCNTKRGNENFVYYCAKNIFLT